MDGIIVTCSKMHLARCRKGDQRVVWKIYLKITTVSDISMTTLEVALDRR